MLHFVTSYMKQNKSRKQTLESAQYGLEIIFNGVTVRRSSGTVFLKVGTKKTLKFSQMFTESCLGEQNI